MRVRLQLTVSRLNPLNETQEPGLNRFAIKPLISLVPTLVDFVWSQH
jgi:hypothetical protein